jgi:hypothetical protein
VVIPNITAPAQHPSIAGSRAILASDSKASMTIADLSSDSRPEQWQQDMNSDRRLERWQQDLDSRLEQLEEALNSAIFRLKS